MRPLIPRRSASAVAFAEVLVFLFLTASCAVAQHGCKFGGQEAAEKLQSALEHAKSCKEGIALFNDCRWGSSADAGFGAIAVARCEKEFYSKLSTAQQNNYADEMQLCAYRFSRQRGTMYVSAAASCQVDLAASIAANPHVADKPVARASFDCNRAQSALEKAICADVGLGRADVLLARMYQRDLQRLMGENRAAFVENEKKWLKELPVKCGLDGTSASRKALGCARNAFEIRFSALDSCIDDEASACLSPDSDPEDYGESPAADPAAPRASFDCNVPTTALQLVICDDHELGQKDIAVAHAFDAALSGSDAKTRNILEESQRKWLEFVLGSCPLGVVGGIPNLLTRGCVRSAYELRAKQLDSCSKGGSSNRAECLNDFKLIPN